MSHSSASTTQPLSTILPWGNPITIVNNTTISSDSAPTTTTTTAAVVLAEHRTLLVTDAPSTDGRFLLHTLALQFLSSRYTMYCNPYQDQDCHDSVITTTTTAAAAAAATARNSNTMEGAVLWITCTPVTERQLMMGLRKALQHNLGGGGDEVGNIGIGKGSSSINNSSSSALGRGGTIGNSNSSSCGPIHIISIPQELADAALSHHNHDDDENPFSHEVYLKGLHRRIVHWLKHRELIRMEMQEQQTQQQKRDVVDNHHNHHRTLGPHLIICDNVTTLGTLVGAKLANSFISSVRSSIHKLSNNRSSLLTSPDAAITSSAARSNSVIAVTVNLFVIRASSPDVGGLYNLDESEDHSMGEQTLRNEYSRLLRPWLGYGSGKSNNMNGDRTTTSVAQLEEQCNYCSLSSDSVPSFLHTSGLYELADGIVDVSPLQSGYARDVLGRMAFVPTWSGQGWWGKGGEANVVSNKGGIDGTSYASLAVNYRCDDSGVRIMRLRSR